MSGDCCSKFILTTINGVFMLFGLAVLIMGVVFQMDWDGIRDAFADQSDKVDINLQEAGDYLGHACIVFGAAIFVLAFVGYCGGKYRIKILLIAYAVVVLILMIGQIVMIALIAANTGDAETKIKTSLRDALKGYDEELKDGKSKAWSALFSTMECCGVDNRTDDFTAETNFNMSKYRNAIEMKDQNPIPIACCRHFDYDSNKQDNKTFNQPDIIKCLVDKSPEYSYTDGCETKVMDLVNGHQDVMLGVGGAIFGIEVIVVVIAFFLTCCERDD